MVTVSDFCHGRFFLPYLLWDRFCTTLSPSPELPPQIKRCTVFYDQGSQRCSQIKLFPTGRWMVVFKHVLGKTSILKHGKSMKESNIDNSGERITGSEGSDAYVVQILSFHLRSAGLFQSAFTSKCSDLWSLSESHLVRKAK